MTYPKCFDNNQQYREWRASAIIAKESVSLCADCSARYQELIGPRCNRVEVRANFTVYDKRTNVDRFSQGEDE